MPTLLHRVAHPPDVWEEVKTSSQRVKTAFQRETTCFGFDAVSPEVFEEVTQSLMKEYKRVVEKLIALQDVGDERHGMVAPGSPAQEPPTPLTHVPSMDVVISPVLSNMQVSTSSYGKSHFHLGTPTSMASSDINGFSVCATEPPLAIMRKDEDYSHHDYFHEGDHVNLELQIPAEALASDHIGASDALHNGESTPVTPTGDVQRGRTLTPHSDKEDPWRRNSSASTGDHDDDGEHYKATCRRQSIRMAEQQLSFKSQEKKEKSFRQKLQTFVSQPGYDISLAALVMLNSMTIGIEVEIIARSLYGERLFWSTLAHSWNIIWSLDVLSRLGAWGCFYFIDPESWYWNWFDATIALGGVIESILLLVQGSEPMPAIKAMRVLRLVRLLRIFRITKLLHMIRPLATLVQSIFSTLVSLAWAMVLLALILYTFAVLLTQASTVYLYDEGNLDEGVLRFFGSVSTTFYTLFMAISGGLSWYDASKALSKVGAIWVWVFCFYIAFTYFAVLNVVTGVFCETAISSQQNDHDHMVHLVVRNKREYIRRLTALFNDVDEDGSGQITLDEFEGIVDDEKVLAYFELLGVDVSDAPSFFAMLDTDKGGSIDVDELLGGCLRMRGYAKATDMVELRREMKLAIKILREMSRDAKFGSPRSPNKKRSKELKHPIQVAIQRSRSKESNPRSRSKESNPRPQMQ